jgi:hypothetical protein
MGEIQMIEATLKLPSGAAPIASYDRYYYADTDAHRRGVSFVFERVPTSRTRVIRDSCWRDRTDGPTRGSINCYARSIPLKPRLGEVHVVTESTAPRIADGGCTVVSGFYDRVARKIVWVQCNGLA